MLTTAQATALKADIQSRSALTASVASVDWPAVAAFYNTAASPSVMVWRPRVPMADLNGAIDWTKVAALSTNSILAFIALTQAGEIDATSTNVRAAFTAIFTDTATRSALATAAQRAATYFEALFAVSGVTPVFDSSLSASDVQQAMGG